MGETVRIQADVLEWREIEGELIALDLRTSTYFALNRTGTSIWPTLVAGAERAQLVEEVVQKFGISWGQAASDVDVFLRELAEKDLLEPLAS